MPTEKQPAARYCISLYLLICCQAKQDVDVHISSCPASCVCVCVWTWRTLSISMSWEKTISLSPCTSLLGFVNTFRGHLKGSSPARARADATSGSQRAARRGSVSGGAVTARQSVGRVVQRNVAVTKQLALIWDHLVSVDSHHFWGNVPLHLFRGACWCPAVRLVLLPTLAKSPQRLNAVVSWS